MAPHYRVKAWKEFQHYRERNPIWIKLHRKLLDNADYFKLSAEAGKALPLVWLIASEKDGSLPPLEELAWRLHLSVKRTESIMLELVKRDFIEVIAPSLQPASRTLAQLDESASPETERETETQNPSETEARVASKEVGFYLEDFDGENEFRKLCESHPQPEDGIATQNVWMQTIERELKRPGLPRKRTEVAREILERARMYAAVPRSFTYGLGSWLSKGIWKQSAEVWSGPEIISNKQRKFNDSVERAFSQKPV